MTKEELMKPRYKVIADYHWWNTKGNNTEEGFDKWFPSYLASLRPQIVWCELEKCEYAKGEYSETPHVAPCDYALCDFPDCFHKFKSRDGELVVMSWE